MSKVFTFRVSDDEAVRAEGFIKRDGLSRQQFLLAAFRSHLEACAGGVPDVPAPETAAEYAEALVRHESGPLPVMPAGVMGDRQARLNAMIDRARGSKR
jgi:hypothetical protein